MNFGIIAQTMIAYVKFWLLMGRKALVTEIFKKNMVNIAHTILKHMGKSGHFSSTALDFAVIYLKWSTRRKAIKPSVVGSFNLPNK